MRRGIRLTGIKTITKPNGKRYVYRRVGSQLVPLPDLPENHPQFLAAYAAAGDVTPRKTRAVRGSIAELCQLYLGSGDFSGLAKSSQSVRRRIVNRIEEKRGTALLKDLRPDHLRRDVRAFTHGAGKNRLKAWRSLIKFAIAEGMISDDPSQHVRPVQGVEVPHRQWTKSEIQQYRAHWEISTPQRREFEVIYWTACGCVDAVKIGWQHVGSDGFLSENRQKTGEVFACPIRSLPPWAESMSGDHGLFLQTLPHERDRLQWITTSTGKPRSVKALSQFISKSARQAGLPDHCTAHGLRKARAAAIAASGGTPSQIGAWLGDVSLSMAAHYTRQADRKAILGAEQEQNVGNSVKKFPKPGK